MADRKGFTFRRWLLSADIFNERAIIFGSFQVKTPCSISRAWLSRVTSADQLFCCKALVFDGIAPYSSGSASEVIKSLSVFILSTREWVCMSLNNYKRTAQSPNTKKPRRMRLPRLFLYANSFD